MKIYTRTGDAGQTSLSGGSRVPKNDPLIEAYGTIDELNSFIGVARSSWPTSPVDRELDAVQNDLFDLGAQLAAPGKPQFTGVDPIRIAALERAIDDLERGLTPLVNFILPGGSAAAASLHVARTVCRRAERLIVGLDSPPETSIAYLNRLSDYLFVAARAANSSHGITDVIWRKRQG